MSILEYLKKIFPILGLLALVIAIQFTIGKKQLEYGFFIDDWDNLAAYKIVIQNPIIDLPYAWKTLGSHRFAHVYYIGVLFEAFKFNYEYYNIFNQLLKALSAFTLFPLIYLLFRSKLLAFLTTIIYVSHYSPFGALDDVSRGEDYLAIICINLFLTLYIWTARKKKFNIKVLISSMIFLLATALLAPSRTYPLIILLPIVEFFNLFFNKTAVKASLLRLGFLYSPFILLFIFSPQPILAQVGYYKALWEMLKLGNFQLFLIPLASFGSTFIPVDFLSSLFGPQNYQKVQPFIHLLLKMSVFFGAIFIGMGALTKSSTKRFAIRSILISVCFSLLAFTFASNWLRIDLKSRASVDPVVFIIPALVGIFILSEAFSFFLEWLETKRKNRLLLGLSVAPILSFLYIFLTWVLSDVNSVFMGVHAYLNIPAIGTSIFLAIIIYLIYLKLNKGIVAKGVIATCIFFLILSNSYTIDKYFSYWLKNGMAYKDQQRMINTFWKEVVRKQYTHQNPVLIYLDSFEDYANGAYYENGFVWRIPSYMIVETGKTLPACDLMMYKVELDKLRIEEREGRKVVVQERCGYPMAYRLENFYSFKLMNRNIIPNKTEILQKLGID